MLDVNEATTQSNGHQATPVRGGAIYCRVSSEEQRENQTIASQIETAKGVGETPGALG